MIDGIEFRVFGVNPNTWLDCDCLSFSTKVNPRTGKAIDGIMKATFRGLTFEIIAGKNEVSFMTVKGSLHRYFNNGIHNADSFSVENLIEVIKELESVFSISPQNAIIQGVEIGLNLEFHHEVKRLLNSAISYKDKTFEVIDARKPSLGRLCSTHDYDIKMYDKVVQSKVSYPIYPLLSVKNLLRFEVSVNKMRWLRGYGVQSLLDITDNQKVSCLIKPLLDIISKIIFIDIEADTTKLTDKENAKYGLFRDRDKWRNCERWQRQDRKAFISRILEKCNAFNYVECLYEMVKNEWSKLLLKHSKGLRLPEKDTTLRSSEKATFAPLEYVRANVANEYNKPSKENSINILSENENLRVCRTCGKDIANQRRDSVYCSEKYKGLSAKKCRNENSNQRRDKKKMVMTAKKKDQFLMVSYLWQGAVYSDLLHASEISPTRKWLDAVVAVKVVSENCEHDLPDIQDQEQAREYLRQLMRGEQVEN